MQDQINPSKHELRRSYSQSNGSFKKDDRRVSKSLSDDDGQGSKSKGDVEDEYPIRSPLMKPELSHSRERNSPLRPNEPS
jgi:hypothetical protein